ncbi:MAG: hypothetical protein WC223_07040 [Bacteroidales bacterium]|jgi:hypothetical protein
MKKIIFFALIVISASKLSGQDYIMGIGYRGINEFTREGLALTNSIDVKYNIEHDAANNKAVEAFLAFRYAGYSFTTFMEIQNQFHLPKMRYSHIYWYYGFGLHYGSYIGDTYFHRKKGHDYAGKVYNFGVDGILGFDYVFYDFPISVGIDAMPFYDIIKPGPSVFNMGFTIRYVIGK